MEIAADPVEACRSMAPRVGLMGFFLEANRFAPVTTGAMFEATFDLAGASLLEELRRPASRALPDSLGFLEAMDALGAWTPVPLRLAAAYPGGPAEGEWFDGFLADVQTRLIAAGPLQGLFISSHGAALAGDEDDPDGLLFERVRAAVGPQVPIVAVLDLHTNVSQRMTDALSGFVAYRTNPHVDLRERGAEAAALLHAMLDQGPGEVVLVKLPFLPASTDQLIAPGTPYAGLLERAQGHVGGDILNVSLCGGFPLADCAKCGFSVVVTAARGARQKAERVARIIAAAVWAERAAFLTALTPLPEAVRLAVEAGAGQTAPLILADVADNPGGGGGGNTTALLRALLDAGAKGVLVAVFTDAALAREAHERGVGACFVAQFNREAGDDRFAEPLAREVTVQRLSDGVFVGRRGLVQGSTQHMGPTALLHFNAAEVQVLVVSRRQQLLDPAQLEVVGVELGRVRTLVAKSRGHFRAAFADFAPPERIVEVDGPGLTTPRLSSLPLQRVPRPIFPLDVHAVWPSSGDGSHSGL
jgi:microcystin degradation protein MlrC